MSAAGDLFDSTSQVDASIADAGRLGGTKLVTTIQTEFDLTSAIQGILDTSDINLLEAIDNIEVWNPGVQGDDFTLAYVAFTGPGGAVLFEPDGSLATYRWIIIDGTSQAYNLGNLTFPESGDSEGDPPVVNGNGNGGNGNGGGNGMDGEEVIDTVAARAPRALSRLRDFRAGVRATCEVLDKLGPFAGILPPKFQIAIGALKFACEVEEVIPGAQKKKKKRRKT